MSSVADAGEAPETNGDGGRRTTTARVLRVVARVVVVVAAVIYLVRVWRESAPRLRDVDLTLRALPLLAASLLTLAGYANNVAWWRRSLRWWRASLDMATALRIWFLSNLARFLPGGIWQFAGLAAMSRDAGVSPYDATAAVLLQQLVLLASGAFVAIVSAPELIGGAGDRFASFGAWASALGPGTRAGLVIVVAVLAIGALALVLPHAGRLARALSSGRASPVVTSWRALTGYFFSMVGTWVAYGVAFWIFAHAILPAGAPPLMVAAPAFIVAYVAGIVVVVAPAGLGVREAVLVATLAPTTGPELALALSLLSRVWLICVELGAALLVLLLPSR